jgi:CubicO group peptidase (beta-lactamase class C family)
VAPAALGWDASTLEKAFQFLGKVNSTGALVLHRGRIVAERYWDGSTLHSASDCFSVQKSLVSVLAGFAVHEGRLQLSEPVARYLGKGWSKSPETEERVTVRHLMTMTSGLTNGLEKRAEPGTVWAYNTPAYQQTKSVIERVTGVQLEAYTREKVWGPIGAQDSRWEQRPNMPFTGWSASARDMARLGLLVLARSTWAGARVLPDEGYLATALSSSQDLNPAYGLLWWLNGTRFHLNVRGNRGEGSLIPMAPADMVQAAGAGDKKIYVVPSLDLVVARHGAPAGSDASEVATGLDAGFWPLLLKAIRV